MSADNGEEQGEIVIIRRKGGEDDCHHGGVWKVAYADFMTAMMAFFLVMWLINAANEATKIQVASYFNPVKLVDTSTNPRGLKEKAKGSSGDVKDKRLKPEAQKAQDPAASSETRREQATGDADNNMKKKAEKKNGPAAHLSGGDVSENDLFRDPIRTLDKIAGGAPDLLKGAARPIRRTDALGADGGMQFRDPFSPRSWESLARDLPEDGATGSELGSQQGEAGRVAARTTGPARDRTKGEPRDKAAKRKAELRAKRMVEDLKKALRAAIANSKERHLPEVKVQRTGEGILISLTDKANFGMFAVGSARPRPETVRFLEKIAKILRTRKGQIIIRGHTDARRYRNKGYDNWRLSTARAHMARYMLIRGGVPESRIVRVEGWADRKPANPKDPLAPQNRRIEILLKGV
jgi:chemotaxis protein MotB